MRGSRRLAIAVAVVLASAACAAPDITVIEATDGANCGAPGGNVTGAVAFTCDGRASCVFAIDRTRIGDPAPGCEKDFHVTWRCTGEEPTHTVTSAAGASSTVALQCHTPAPRRIDILDASAGHRPVPGLTAAVIERCAGVPACTLSVGGLPPLAALGDAPDVRVHWRCEGEMIRRETPVPAEGEAQLACE